MPQPKSKKGCVGRDMPGALKGDQDNRGPISTNYKGRPGNANPNHPNPPREENAKPISDWTKRHMKERREEAAIEREKQKDNSA